MNIDEILKEINDAVKELNEEGIECSFDNQIIITKI
jgi:hypothetical protein